MSPQIPKCVSFAIFPQNSDIFKLDIKLNCIAKQKYIYSDSNYWRINLLR